MATFTTSDRTRLHHVDRGAGEPALVFVHGWCSNLDAWATPMDRLEPDHRVIALDRRGHGRSDPSPSGYTVERHAADLAELLDHLDATGTLVVGHAGGVPTCLQMAVERPDLVGGVVAIEARLGPPAADARSGLRSLVAALRGPDGAAVLERTYRSFFNTAAGEASISAARAVPLDVVADELESLAIDSEALARSVSQPVWWVTVERADRSRIESLFRTVDCIEVAGGGHFPQVEAAEELTDAIARIAAALRR